MVVEENSQQQNIGGNIIGGEQEIEL